MQVPVVKVRSQSCGLRADVVFSQAVLRSEERPEQKNQVNSLSGASGPETGFVLHATAISPAVPASKST